MKTIELPASKKGESCQTDVGWCDQNDALAEFVDRLGPDTLSLADLIGAQTLKKIEKLSIPLIATFEEETRQTTYRRAEGMSDFVAHKIPNAVWIEIDPRTSLKRALALYSDRLLAYEKMNRKRTLEVIILPVWERKEATLRLLVRRPSSDP
jgi:hypothetical protein